MKDLKRNITLLCPLCGNDQFESIDCEFEDLKDAPEDIRLRCSDCDSIYAKQELIEANSENIDYAVEEMKDEIVKEFDKELKKVLKKWKL